MNKILTILVILILVIMLSIFYITKDVITPSFNTWIGIVIASFIVVFGFMIGIKFMSDL